MKIKNILFFILLIFSLLIFNKSFALQIKNVNYSASNNNDRWIEIFNDGEDILDFTANIFKVIDSTDETNHRINLLLGDATFPAGSTVFISPSTSIPPGAEKAFRSPYGLNRTNGYIILDNNGTKICFNYGNGVCGEQNTTTNTGTSSSTSETGTTTNKEKIVYVYVPQNNQDKYGDIQVLLPEEKVVPALAEVEYTVKVTDSSKKTISDLDFHWSFGDGGEKFGRDVSYTYVYPGEYVLIASADGYLSGGKARMNVKVVKPDIYIEEIGTTIEENFIILKNNTDYDLFLSNFYLNVDGNLLKLPKNLMIAKNKSLRLSGEALGFKLPAKNISLLYPNKNVLTIFKETVSGNPSILDLVNATSGIQLEVEENFKALLFEMENKPKTPETPKVKAIQKPIYQNFENLSKNAEFGSDKKESGLVYFKRLVLSNDFSEKENFNNSNISLKTKENSRNTNVDTRLINWFKNLIYY